MTEENKHGYARHVTTNGIHTLDIIDNTGQQLSIDFKDGYLDKAKQELIKAVASDYTPAPHVEGCEFIKL